MLFLKVGWYSLLLTWPCVEFASGDLQDGIRKVDHHGHNISDENEDIRFDYIGQFVVDLIPYSTCSGY